MTRAAGARASWPSGFRLGQAELRKRRDLPPAYVEYVVRHGVGSMPQFTPTELTDAQLAALAQWLAKED